MFGIDKSELDRHGVVVNNIVAKLDLDTELDLNYLSSALSNSSYLPEHYPSLVLRPDDLSTIMITKTGNILFNGSNSTEMLQRTYDYVSNKLESVGVKDVKTIQNVEIVNIVCNFDTERELDLDNLAIILGLENTEYEPEQFPGLIYRIENGPVLLIFSNGKMVVTGGTTTEEIVSAKDRITEMIPEECP